MSCKDVSCLNISIENEGAGAHLTRMGHVTEMFTNDMLMFEGMNGLDIILRRVTTGYTKLPVPRLFIHSVFIKVLVYDSVN